MYFYTYVSTYTTSCTRRQQSHVINYPKYSCYSQIYNLLHSPQKTIPCPVPRYSLLYSSFLYELMLCYWPADRGFCTLTEAFLNLTEVFSYPDWDFSVLFSLSCKANARVKLAKTGHGPHFSTLVVICVVRLLFMLFYVLFVCKCVLPPGDNPIAVNKYISLPIFRATQMYASRLEYSTCFCVPLIILRM